MLFRPDKAETKIQMTSWSVREVSSSDINEGSTQHLIGLVNGYGRVCSPIQEFDRETMIATTRSGKQYKLLGEPGLNMDAAFVFENWCQMYKITQVTDITDQYWLNESP